MTRLPLYTSICMPHMFIVPCHWTSTEGNYEAYLSDALEVQRYSTSNEAMQNVHGQELLSDDYSVVKGFKMIGIHVNGTANLQLVLP